MNLNQLRIFHAVAHTQGFTRAAEHLHLTQPGVSKHIKELEAYYGVRLFDRLGKRVVPTQAGEVLFATTSRIFDLLEDAETRIADLKGTATGRLSVGASVTVGTHILPSVLAEFSRKYPDIEIALHIDLSDRIATELLSNKLDVGLLGASVIDDRLSVYPFREDHLLLIAPSDHPWTRRNAVGIQDLQGQRFLVAGQGSGTRRIVEQRLKEAGVDLVDTMEFGNTEGVKRAVQAGLGLAILSKAVVQSELDTGSLASIHLDGISVKRRFYVALLKDKYITNAVRTFLRLLAPAVAEFE